MYNAHGVEGLRPRSRVGWPCRLQENHIKVLMACIEDGLAREDGLPSRLRVCDIWTRIGNVFAICYSWEGPRRLLHRLGLSGISTRSIHPKADPQAQEAFRQDFKDLVRKAVGQQFKGEIEIWFQDEARMVRWVYYDVYAPGKRPRIKRDWRFKSCTLFKAACPEYHLEATHLCKKSNTDERNRHLAAIGASVHKSHHGVGVLDQATWHRSRDLKIPSNLSLLHLPPYAPELNPIENVSNYLSNRVFETLEEIKAQTKKAWQTFADDPNRMKSIMHQKWAVAPTCENQTSVI